MLSCPNDRRSCFEVRFVGYEYLNKTLTSTSCSDISEIVTDLGYTGIRHYDIRGANALRVLENGSACDDMENQEGGGRYPPGFCNRHQKVHAWRLIDFDRASKTVFQDRLPREKNECLRQSELVGNEYFLGTLIPWEFPYLY